MSRVLPDADPAPRTADTNTPVPSTGTSASETTALARLRRMGQALALPIAAMPAAGLLLRAGQDDLLGRFGPLHETAMVMSGAGAAILDYLPLLFTLGIGLGMNRTKDRVGPVLACVVSYLVLARVVLVLNSPLPAGQLATPPARWPYGALAGIIAGLLALAVWKGVAGRRHIPPFVAYGLVIVAAAAAGTLLGLAYPAVDRVLTASAGTVAHHAIIGGGLFGFLNRLLLPIGLHTPLNLVLWYLTGDCGGIKGDVPCFIQAHDPHAGSFLTGFFPVAMAGLPAAALAMWHCAHPDQRRRVATLLLPAAALSALTGVTEPIELSFVFVAFPLYLVHAVLTGLSLALVNWLGIRSGFVFSAGALDYFFNYSISTKPLLLLPISAAYGALYYVVFRFLITRFNLRTPGRTPVAAEETEQTSAPSPTHDPPRTAQHPTSPSEAADGNPQRRWN
ncbi:PTS transporter subunit EIIC [Streptomyces sp. H10-C2]|uniref:PTS transporter subunit EIIC n=1 Tax=unclassified Streptomyces TaxID=2593676 RepID=UPI0024B91E3B|nr:MULTISPECIES: PTS transporter subunit EIIC [unclassified Streptomyces]MDJ0342840.1 PTS transporter subunit EIIC [Streptomyces sp. PH10-H1]MDJ0372518.1 PTS transporter subunit EIIC [Streptomyces sp. H10-C2]